MDRNEAIGLLVIGHLNQLPLRPEDDDEDFPGCCTVHCGMCAALKWLSQNARDEVDNWILHTEWAKDSWSFWDEGWNGVDWDLVNSIWNRHKGCSISNGVQTPCKEDEEEGDEQVGSGTA